MQKFIIFLSFISLSLQVDHCFIEQKICKRCKEGYYLIENSYCSKIDHCLYMNGDSCSQCESGYYFDSAESKCIKGSIDYCYNYNSGDITKCSSCENGYTLNSERTVCTELNLPHCSYSNDGSTCSYCLDGYALNSATNECIEKPGCDEVNEDGSKCLDCSEDFYQPDKDGKCVIHYCEEYDSDGNCEECDKYFYVNEEGKCQYIPIPYCREGNETYCKDYAGFMEDEEGDPNKAKEKYEKRCERRDDDGNCYMCEQGYTLDATTHECVSNCEEYIEPSPLCDYCEHGYILIDDDKTCYSVLGGNEKNEEDGIEFIKLSLLLNLFLILLNC